MTESALPLLAARPSTILIVDDAPANLGVIVESLEERGYRIVVAQDSAEALQRADLVQPDLILLDIMMPEMDGIEVCRRLKNQAGTRETPVIFMTALAETEHKLAGFRAGAVDYVAKPLQIEEVVAHIDIHLSLRAMQKRLEAQNAELQRYRDELELRVEERTAELRAEIASRKRAELAALNESLRLQTLIQSIPDPVWLKDAQGVYLACNDAICRLFGASEADILGKTDWDFVDAELAEFVRQKDRETILAGRPCVNEEWVTHPVNGRQILFETIKTPLYDTNGEVVGVLGVARDITEHHRLETELRSKEQYQRALLDNFPFMVWLKDTQSRFLAVNQPFAEAAGFKSSEEIDGKTDLDVWPRDLAESYRADDREVLRSGNQKTVEEHIAEQGVRKWFETYKAPVMADGKLLGTVGFARDITERKLLEENLAAREREFRTLTENLPDILIRYDKECRVLYFNRAVEQSVHPHLMSGLGEASRKTFPSVEGARQFQASLRQVIDSGDGCETEILVRDPAGIVRTHLVSIVAERDAAGAILGALAIGRDISTIKETERQLRTLVENMPDFIMRMDIEGRHLYVSPAVIQAFNLPSEHFVGRTVTEIALTGDPQSDSQMLDAVRKAVKDEMPVMLTTTIANAAGDRVFDVLYVPERDEYGHVVSVLGVARDITSLQLAHRALQKKEALLRSLIDSIPDLIFFKDMDSVYLGFNQAFAEYCGYSEAQMSGKTDYDFTTREIADFYRQKDREMLASGMSRHNEEWITYPDGSQVLLDTLKTPLHDAAGNIIGVIGICRDITQRKLMEQALIYREQEFRTMVENSPDIVVRYDRDYRRVYVNRAYEALHGIRRQEVLGTTPLDFWRLSVSPQEYLEMLRRVMTNGVEETLVCEMTVAEGEIFHSMRLVPEYGLDGSVESMLAISRDISTLIATERRLETSRAQLRDMAARREGAREEERKHIAREIHDELGQLLSVLRLNISMLDYRYGEDNADLRVKAGNMTGVVDQAIDRIRNLATRLRPAVLSSGIIPALEWLVQEFSRNTGIACTLEVAESGIRFDEERGMQVFRIVQESLTNVLRHSGADRVEVSLRRHKGRLIAKVRDNGKGFDPDKISRKDSFGILGMQERMMMLEGELEITSAPGRGTELRLRFPLDARAVMAGEHG